MILFYLFIMWLESDKLSAKQQSMWIIFPNNIYVLQDWSPPRLGDVPTQRLIQCLDPLLSVRWYCLGASGDFISAVQILRNSE